MNERLKQVRALKAQDGRGKSQLLTLEEGLEAIAAYRRGVSPEEIGKAVGSSRGAFYARLGTWAMKHCGCVKKAGGVK